MCHTALDIVESIVKWFFKQRKFSPGDVNGVGNTVIIHVIAIAVMLFTGIKKRISEMQWAVFMHIIYIDMLCNNMILGVWRTLVGSGSQ